jgi:hypothetical protein
MDFSAHIGSSRPIKPWACAVGLETYGEKHWSGVKRGGRRHCCHPGLYRCRSLWRRWGPWTSRLRPLQSSFTLLLHLTFPFLAHYYFSQNHFLYRKVQDGGKGVFFIVVHAFSWTSS